MYERSREIGQPGSYLAQASFRKFVCVRGSVSSVLRCARGRNEYRNNVSMGMTRRSFYLLNLWRISRDGCEERQKRRKKRGSGKMEREEKRGEASPTMEIRFIVFGLLQYSHRAVLKASRISIYLFEARKRDSLRLPRFEWCTGCWITIKREMHFLPLRATTHLWNVAVRSLADVLSGHHDFVSMTTRMRMTRKTWKTKWVWNSDIPGQRECRNFKADSIGSVDSRVSRDIVSSVDAPRANACFFTAFDKRWGLSDR